ncbi:hypothetical protein Aduo_015969 [Ancylostoma duodenale]
MASIRSCKTQITKSINKLNEAVNGIDTSLFQQCDLPQQKTAAERLDILIDQKASLFEVKTRIELLLEHLKEKLAAAIKLAKNTLPNASDASAIEEIDEHWEQHEGDECEERAYETIVKICASIKRIDILMSNLTRDGESLQSYAPTSRNLNSSFNQLNDACDIHVQREFSRPSRLSLNTPCNDSNVIPGVSKQFEVKDATVTPAVDHVTNILPGQIQKLQVEPFYGDIEKFSEFWCTFDTLIHSNPNIPVSAKFIYLKLALKGNASHVLLGIHNTNENYALAVEMLHKRFNRPQHARNAIFQHLKDLAEASSSSLSQRNTCANYSHCSRNYLSMKISLPLQQCYVSYSRSFQKKLVTKSREENTPRGLRGR